MDFKELGFTEKELQERIVDKIVAQMMVAEEYDEDVRDTVQTRSPFQVKLEKLIQKRIDEAVEAMADKYVLPKVAEYIENLSLQETNRWGEKTGKPVTFIEYLVQRAEHYMTEQVDYKGKTKSEDSYSWKGTQTRVAHMIHEHLQYSISTAMREALANANSQIAKGLQDTVKIKLGQIATSLKVTTETKD
jgi:hypothetical protein